MFMGLLRHPEGSLESKRHPKFLWVGPAWESILEYTLSNCNRDNQAQLRQPWSFYCVCIPVYKFPLQ